MGSKGCPSRKRCWAPGASPPPPASARSPDPACAVSDPRPHNLRRRRTVTAPASQGSPRATSPPGSEPPQGGEDTPPRSGPRRQPRSPGRAAAAAIVRRFCPKPAQLLPGRSNGREREREGVGEYQLFYSMDSGSMYRAGSLFSCYRIDLTMLRTGSDGYRTG